MIDRFATFARHEGKMVTIEGWNFPLVRVRSVYSRIEYSVHMDDLVALDHEVPPVRESMERILIEADDREEYHNWLETVE